MLRSKFPNKCKTTYFQDQNKWVAQKVIGMIVLRQIFVGDQSISLPMCLIPIPDMITFKDTKCAG